MPDSTLNSNDIAVLDYLRSLPLYFGQTATGVVERLERRGAPSTIGRVRASLRKLRRLGHATFRHGLWAATSQCRRIS